jgi:hypothetical protein
MDISGKETIRGKLCLRFKCMYISGKETIRGKLCLRFKCMYISGKETIGESYVLSQKYTNI